MAGQEWSWFETRPLGRACCGCRVLSSILLTDPFLWGSKNLPSVLQRGENKTSKDLTEVWLAAGCPQGTSDTLFGQEGAWEGLPAASGLCSGLRTPLGCFPCTHRIGSARTRAHSTTGLTWLLTTGHCQGFGLQKDPLQVYAHLPCLCSSS